MRPRSLKPNSLILHTVALALVPLQLLFSVFLLLRGHDEPGGGFIGGLVAAGAFVFYLFAHGLAATRRILRVTPHDLLAAGLLLALLSMVPGLLTGHPPLTALWWTPELPGAATELKLSTVLLFDIGVYLAVLGTILIFVVSLAEAELPDSQ